jgi:hypothetical protein
MADPIDDQERERLRQQKIQRQLDEALADSFPASDRSRPSPRRRIEWDEDATKAAAKKAAPTPGQPPGVRRTRRGSHPVAYLSAPAAPKPSVVSEFGDPRHGAKFQPVVIVN